MAKKATSSAPKSCQITRAQFRTSAPKGKTVMDKIVEEIGLSQKEFSSGGFGYYGGGKITLMIDGEPVKCQVGINVSIVNSKCAVEGTEDAAAESAADAA